jgi:hypothetical protein
MEDRLEILGLSRVILQGLIAQDGPWQRRKTDAKGGKTPQKDLQSYGGGGESLEAAHGALRQGFSMVNVVSIRIQTHELTPVFITQIALGISHWHSLVFHHRSFWPGADLHQCRDRGWIFSGADIGQFKHHFYHPDFHESRHRLDFGGFHEGHK